MFNVGGGEILVIMLIALIVLGPNRLPDAARQIGKAMSELRRLSSSFQNEVRSAIDSADDPKQVATRRNVLHHEDADTPDAREVRPKRTQPLVAAPAEEPAATPTKPVPTKPDATKKAKAKPRNGTEVQKKTAAPKPAPRRAKSP